MDPSPASNTATPGSHSTAPRYPILLGILLGGASVATIAYFEGQFNGNQYVVATVATFLAILLGGWQTAIITEIAATLASIWFNLEPHHTWVVGPTDRPGLFIYLTALMLANVLYFRLDIARRRAMTREERAAEERRLLEQILATNPSAIITLDEFGHVVYANEIAGRFAGVRTGDQRGVDFDSRRWERRTLDGQPLSATLTPAARVHEENAGYSDWRYQMRISPTDPWRVVSTSAAPVRDPAGAIRYVVVTTTDITEQWQAEAEIRRQQHALEEIAASVPGMIFQWKPINGGPKGRYVYASPRSMDVLGVPPEILTGQGLTVTDMVIEEDREAYVAAARRAIAHDASYDAEARIERPNGTISWIRSMGRPIELADGTRAWTGIVLDVTDQHRLAQELHQAQKLESIGQLAGGIAHDFNNILTAILGYAEVVAEGVLSGSVQADDVEQIRLAAERASSLTNQLLTFSRRQTVVPRHVDLRTVLADLEKFLRRLLGKSTSLVWSPGGAPCPVFADPGQLHQVALNLVVNARDAMPGGGAVVLGLDRVQVGEELAPRVPAGEYVLLRVSDQGTGIPPDVLERIFEPFFTTKAAGKGTGLGLATVHGIVTGAGGHIVVESEVGRGTTFRVYLPFDEDGASAESVRADRREHSRQGRRGVILLVEDDDAVRDLARRTLASSGYHVLEARHAAEAQAILSSRGGRFDCLVTDMIMPGMSGAALLQLLRQDRPTLPAVLLSGYTTERLDDLPAEDGPVPTRFVPKPFGKAQLLEAVEAVWPTPVPQDAAVEPPPV